MKYPFIKIRQISGSILLSLLTAPAMLSQSSEDLPTIGELFRNSERIILINSDFSSQQNIFGNNPGLVSQPYFTQGISWYTGNNFDFTVQGGIVGNSDESYSKAAYDLSFYGGYTWNINPRTAIRPSYSHMEYSKNTNAFQSIFTDNLQLDFYYQRRQYNGAAYASYLFAQKDMFYGTIKNGYLDYFSFGKEGEFTFGVGADADINFSDKNYYNELVYNSWPADEFTGWVQENYSAEDYADVLRLINRYDLRTAKQLFKRRIAVEDPESFSPSYTITSLNFTVPLSLNYGRFYFYTTPTFFIPTAKSKFYEQKSFLYISMGLSIEIF